MVDFWNKLEWPVHSSAQLFVTQLSEHLCQGACYYSDLVHEKLSSAGYYDDTKRLDFKKQVRER